MAWIEFHGSRIKRLQKFQDLRFAMSWSVNETLGFLGNLWGEVIELREDGDLTGLRPEYVAELCSVPVGSARKLWAALVEHGWITVTAEGRALLHDWLDFAGGYLRSRYKTRKRERLVEIWRKHGRAYGKDEPEEGREVRGKCAGSLPDLTLPDQTNLPDVRQVDSGQEEEGVHANGALTAQGVKITANDLRRRGELLARLGHRMPFGEKKGVEVGNLDPVYCNWLLNDWGGRESLDPKTRSALTARVELKALEARH